MNNKYLIFAGMGIELVGIEMGCLYFGQKIDELYDLKGLAMVGFSVLGLTGWLIQIVKLSQKLDKQADE